MWANLTHFRYFHIHSLRSDVFEGDREANAPTSVANRELTQSVDLR